VRGYNFGDARPRAALRVDAGDDWAHATSVERTARYSFPPASARTAPAPVGPSKTAMEARTHVIDCGSK
jgi:hypothetical protein